jgi:hypothetical protein
MPWLVNVARSRCTALACALALGSACGGRTVDAGTTFAGPASAGQSAGSGLAGTGSGDGAGGGVSQGASGGAGASSMARASGGATSVGPGHAGFANGGTGSGASGGGFSTGGSVSSGAGANSAGSGGGAATGGDPSPPSAPIPATWDTVKLVLSGTRPPCSGCHGMGDGGFRITLNNDSQLFKSLTTTVVKDCGNNPVVTPGDPSKSALLEIIQGDCSMKTPRMPPGCVDGDAGCVPPDYVAAVSQWISDGAPRP